MKNLRRLLTISKQVSARQKENMLRSSIGKKLLLTPFIMDNRETSLYLQEKDHEDYQEIKGKKYPMDERVLIREILEEDAKKKA